MMLEVFFPLVIFLWVTAITPGPNNMLLAVSGARYGFFPSLPLLMGIMLGMQSLLLLVSLGVGGVLLLSPLLHDALKVVGSLYLLYIAWKMAVSGYEKRHPDEVSEPKVVSWYQGCLLQFLNPKAWLMGIGAVTSFSLKGEQYCRSILVMSGSMLLVNLLAGVIWLGLGMTVSQFLHSRRAWLIFNWGMSLLTAGCVLLVWH